MTQRRAAGTQVRAALIGVTGRMGLCLVRTAALFPTLTISAAVAAPASAALGQDAGELAGIASLGVPVGADLAGALRDADVALDFSHASATRANLTACHSAGTALLLGTTGYGAELAAEFALAARDIALMVAPNTSVGATVLMELARLAAHALPEEFDIGILESHHLEKRDAPSGTALALREALRGTRSGTEAAISSVRTGNTVGEHTVLFSSPGEQLSLQHRASDRAIFARGALTAALWLAARPPGRYAMRDLVS
jgi:4-hydroxy-tetrahydrodipicolinate reductase